MGFRQSNRLPYGVSDVKFANNQPIDAINVNQVVRQLRDNDLFIENQFRCAAVRQDGPKELDKSVSSTYSDGSKYWKDDGNDVMLLRKQNVPMQETLVKAKVGGSEVSENANYVVRWSGVYFAGTDSNVLWSRDGLEWSVLQSGKSVASFASDGVLLVGCGNAIYSARVPLSDGTPIMSRATGSVSNPTAIGVDDRSRLFVGTQDGQILTADFGSLANVGQTEVNLATTGSYGQGSVNGFSFLPRTGRHSDSDYVLATADSAVLQSGHIAEMTGENYTDYGGSIVNVMMYGGAVYVCGLMGICRFGQTS